MGCKPSGTRSEEFRFFAHNDLSGPLLRLSAGPEITWHGSLSADIYWVRFDPALGVKIQKIRPALIVQNEVANRHSPETIVAAITSRYQEPLYPTEVRVKAPEGGFASNGVVLLNTARVAGCLPCKGHGM